MSTSADPSDESSAGFLAPRPGGEPTDHCFRCGKPTPAGEGLCDEHNPRHLRGPSSTQMHATVFGGIVLGVVGFFVLARLAVGTSGPFTTEVLTATAARLRRRRRRVQHRQRGRDGRCGRLPHHP